MCKQWQFYYFPWSNCYFCHYMFTSFQSLILEPGFCDLGKACKTIVFYKEASKGHGGGVLVPRRPHRVLLSYIEFFIYSRYSPLSDIWFENILLYYVFLSSWYYPLKHKRTFQCWWSPIYLFFPLMLVILMSYIKNPCQVQGHHILPLCFLLIIL